MTHRDKPPLRADGSGPNPLGGNTKVTRQDWLTLAMDVLVSQGVEKVKVLTLGKRLGVSRSSFYWYFDSRQDLLDALLDHWQRTNTAAIIGQAEASAASITEAVCNVFKGMVNPDLFDTALDFAVREWARRSGKVRRILDLSDQRRLDALAEMFVRFGYEKLEATTRARVLYYMQVGYNEAELNEPMEDRLKLLPSYLLTFTGVRAPRHEIDAFADYIQAVQDKRQA